MAAVLAYAHENAVEPFLEPSLGICAALFSRVDLRETSGSDPDALDAAIDGAPLLGRRRRAHRVRSSAGETEVASFAVPALAAESLRLAVDLFPEEASRAILPEGRRWRTRSTRWGTAAAVGTGANTGFADVDLPTGDPGAGAGASSGSSSPRRAARARAEVGSRRHRRGCDGGGATAVAPLDSTSLSPGETTRLEAALRRGWRVGSRAGHVARAAAEAADGWRRCSPGRPGDYVSGRRASDCGFGGCFVVNMS